MFGLPIATTILVFGFPVFWILYTAIFLLVSRDWDEDSPDGDDSS